MALRWGSNEAARAARVPLTMPHRKKPADKPADKPAKTAADRPADKPAASPPISSDALADERDVIARAEAMLTSGHHDLAQTLLANAIEREPDNGGLQAMLAWAQFCTASDKHQVKAATRRVLLTAIARADDPTLPTYCLARVERMLDRDREALELYRRVLALDPTLADVRDEIRMLERRVEAETPPRRKR